MELFTSTDDYCLKKLLAAAEYAGCNLTVKTATDSDLLEMDSLAQGFVLKTNTGMITRQNAILRFLGEVSPVRALTGSSAHECAQVDQWLGHVWNEIEVPLQVLLSKSGVCGVELSPQDKAALDAKVRAGFPAALSVLDTHLEDKTFFVGERVSIADISICCTIHTLKSMRLLDPTVVPSLFRWFMTVSSQRIMKNHLTGAPQTTTPTPSVSGAGLHFKWQRNRVRIKELLAQGETALGQQVTVMGWIRTSRSADKGAILFVELTDGSTPKGIQIVLVMESTPGAESVAACGGVGASLSVSGTVVQSSGKGQTIEIQGTKAEVLGAVYGGENGEIGGKLYPMAKKQHTLEFLRENAHLRPRSKVFSAALRVRHAMAFAVHNFYNERGFVYVHTPLITAADCEGAGEQFLVTTLLPKDDSKPSDIPVTKTGAADYSKDFFGRRCCLTVSGQLNVETHACALSDVYTFGPTFRAENSHTSRHLAEFWMIEPEICFADIWDGMTLAEDFIKYCTQYALDHCADDLEYFEEQYPKGEKGLRARLRNVVDSDFARISYTEAVALLQEHIAAGTVVFENPVEWGGDLNSEHERYLSETVRVYGLCAWCLCV